MMNAKSSIAQLFDPAVILAAGDEDLAWNICRRTTDASILLDAAIRALDEGAEDCAICYEAGELLRAYRAAIEITLDQAEEESMFRRLDGKEIP
jgi:hypothetical protein